MKKGFHDVYIIVRINSWKIFITVNTKILFEMEGGRVVDATPCLSVPVSWIINSKLSTNFFVVLLISSCYSSFYFNLTSFISNVFGLCITFNKCYIVTVTLV